MNKQRRNRIFKMVERINEIVGILETARDEEQEALDNLPESIRESERGERMEEYIDALDNAVEYLIEGVSTIEDGID